MGNTPGTVVWQRVELSPSLQTCRDAAVYQFHGVLWFENDTYHVHLPISSNEFYHINVI